MEIYFIILSLIALNGLLFGKKRKWFVISSFLILIVVAALRSSQVGVDLQLHYIPNYEKIANISWGQVGSYFVGRGQYDIGFVYLCKLLSVCSDDGQFFIVATSIFIFASFALFIYRYSSDVVLDTILLLTSFSFFQHMCIIAQSLAVAIVLYGIESLKEKKYVKYVAIVFVASLIHSSAIICFVFILLQKMELKRKNIFIYISAITAALFGYQTLVPIMVNRFFPAFSFYIGQEKHGMATGLGPTGRYYLALYAFCTALGLICLYLGMRKEAEYSTCIETKRKKIVIGSFSIKLNTTKAYEKFSLVFLIYTAISAFFFYAASLQMEISRRFMYYFTPFAFLLVGQALKNMKNRKMAQILKYTFYIFTIGCFFLLGENMARSGPQVVPYNFFWK